MGLSFAKAECPVILHASESKEDDDEDVMDLRAPAKVSNIIIDGLAKTQNELVTKHLEHVFDAKTFDAIISEAHSGKLKLERIGIFANIEVFVDIDRKNDTKKDRYDVYYFVKEKRRIGGNVGTNVGQNEGNMILGAKLNNLRGLGEALNANISFGTKVSSSYEFSCSKPMFYDPDKKLSLRVIKAMSDFTQSFYKEDSKGLGVAYTIPSLLGVHTIGWDYHWRSNLISQAAPFEVREHAGHSMKSSLKHSLVSDGRDDWIFPSKGHLLRHLIEYSGIGGNAKFLKTDLEVQLNKEIFRDIVLTGSVQTGFAKSLTESPLLINDRYFIGGPLSVRGYAMKGIGEHSDQASLGGDLYFGTGLHLYTPLPFRPGKGGFGELFRLHLFTTSGNITDLNSVDLKDFLGNPRYSYGIGIMFMLGGMARLEVNYCVPRNSRQGDVINPGLQVGVGLNFL